MPETYSRHSEKSKAQATPLEFSTRGIRVSARGFREASKIRRAINRLPEHHLQFVESVHAGDYCLGQYKIQLQGQWYMPGNGPITDKISDHFAEALSA
jgi:hypothetical protein